MVVMDLTDSQWTGKVKTIKIIIKIGPMSMSPKQKLQVFLKLGTY